MSEKSPDEDAETRGSESSGEAGSETESASSDPEPSTFPSQAWFESDRLRVQFYTGLPNNDVMSAIFNLVAPEMPVAGRHTKYTHLLMTLMRMKHNYSFEYLERRLGVKARLLPAIFVSCIDAMYDGMRFAVDWLDRDAVLLTTPLAFRRTPPACSVIVDRLEILVDRPVDPLAGRQTWSPSKWHHTIKFLLGMTPQGTISFVSKGWGGATPFRHIFQHCDLLKDFKPEDYVILNGDLISRDDDVPCAVRVGEMQSDVRTRPTSADIADHVRRVTGVLRRNFAILEHFVFPIDYVMLEDGQTALLEKMVVVCGALSNCCMSILLDTQ